MIQASCYGRLGRDPETRTAASGKAWTSAPMAVDVTGRNDDADRTMWVRLVAFGKQSDALARHRRGDLLSAIGRLTMSVWTDREGNERESWQMVVEALVSAHTVRPGGGRKKAQPAGEARRECEGAPFDDEMAF